MTMRLFPEGAHRQLEFDKIRDLLASYCRIPEAKEQASDLRIHTDPAIIRELLGQVEEFRQLLVSGLHLPVDISFSLAKELRLLSIPGSTLSGDQFLLIRRLADTLHQVFRWFNTERRELYPVLSRILAESYYEKAVIEIIDAVFDEYGRVKDQASDELMEVRSLLSRKRAELRRQFEKIVARLNKQGYLADIEESFMNGRRVLAVHAENKRVVKGVLHSESDSRRTSFIEPEETMELNNEIFSLEYREQQEVLRILRQTTADLSHYSSLLNTYFDIVVTFDLVAAKAKMAMELGAACPHIRNESHIDFRNAYHPLLLIYHRRSGQETKPISVKLDGKDRILVISGPNAGGKTVTLKTVGLLQLMLQSGLLIPVHPDSEAGIFKQLMIHIGDTQSIELDLSTYSSQLKNMKYFMEHANGSTLFFIDELGSGSDPNLGGAFAEVILEEMAHRRAIGIVTTHYLNLKVMASRVPGMINGAMLFDEQNLLPLYRLEVGKPGSSYTFSIAERIGLDAKLIERARKLVNEEHFRLDKLLNSTEQHLRSIQKEKSRLDDLIRENEKLKKEMEQYISREKHERELELLRQRNRLTDEKIAYLKDLERKMRAMIIEWKKAEDKSKVIPMIHALLFRQRQQMVTDKQQKKFEEKYEELGGEIRVGDKVRMRKSRQVGIVKEIKGKKALLQLGNVPVRVLLDDLVPVREK